MDHQLPLDDEQDDRSLLSDGTPDCNTIDMVQYEMFESHDELWEHPIESTVMEDESSACWPQGEEVKVMYITNFLGSQADWPLVFLWRPGPRRLGLMLPHFPAEPDDLEEQHYGPCIDWAGVLQYMKGNERIAREPQKTWQPGADTADFAFIFFLLVKFFRGQRIRKSHPEETRRRCLGG